MVSIYTYIYIFINPKIYEKLFDLKIKQYLARVVLTKSIYRHLHLYTKLIKKFLFIIVSKLRTLGLNLRHVMKSFMEEKTNERYYKGTSQNGKLHNVP